MGVTYANEEQKITFDFEHDGAEDVVNLTDEGYQVEAFGKCLYYGYELSPQTASSVRGAFIKYVTFTQNLQDHPGLTLSSKKAVDGFNKKINLYDYDRR